MAVHSQTESEPLLIAGGDVVDTTGVRAADVLVEHGVIDQVGEGLAATLEGRDGQLRVIDATGALVAPGLVDLFARLGEPGNEAAETVASAADAAALGGYTAVVAQPDTTPALDHLEALAQHAHLAQHAKVDVISAATLTAGREGHELVPMAELADAGVRWFTDVGPVDDLRLLIAALRWSAVLDVTVAVQPSTTSLAAGAAMHEGPVSARLGVVGEPAVSEEIAVATALAALRATGGRLHLDRISTAVATEAVRDAKREELAVSASVTADHLLFTSDACASFDPLSRNVPPYRTARDRDALIEAVADGTIDAVTSGHTPLAPEQVDVPFEVAEAGTIGLQTAAAVALDVAGLSVEAALAAMSWRPAALIGKRADVGISPGAPADLVVIDPSASWQLDPSDLASRCANTPHLGRSFNSRVTHTVFRGEVVVREAALATRATPSRTASR